MAVPKSLSKALHPCPPPPSLSALPGSAPSLSQCSHRLCTPAPSLPLSAPHSCEPICSTTLPTLKEYLTLHTLAHSIP
eukprot:3339020-Rhodomonas_salina.2